MPIILLVDDDAHVSHIMSMWLTRHGYEVETAAHGAEALERLRSGGIDMIVSDLNMPVMDGADLVRAMRDEGLRQLPVILLTARCERDSLTKELGTLGVTVYPKPFVPSRLVQEVRERLGEKDKAQLTEGVVLVATPEPVGSRTARHEEP